MNKKSKFVKIKECLDTAVLPGRQLCNCLGMKHKLVNNCLSCGRIVCAQEGEGPCMFCGDVVMNKDDRSKMVKGNTKEVQRLQSKYNRIETIEKEREAQATKERLLEYDRTSARRTKVIDDQSDYFTPDNPWLTEQEKKLVKENKEAFEKAKSRRETKITIDFAGRRIIKEAPELPFQHDIHLITSKSRVNDSIKVNDEEWNKPLMKPEFLGDLAKYTSHQDGKLWSNRLQDPELQEMVDSKSCLSISQPYASLIMDGIKKFEGRSWYTPLRGRLWISSGQKVPAQDLIESVQAFYIQIIKNVTFPKKYPTGVLLGCVELLDCLPQEEFLELYPEGEVEDPYVFVLGNPCILKTPIPLQNKSKIFKLEKHIHDAARKILM